MFGWSCNTAHYTYDECFGETWIRAANKGAALYISASDYIYWGSYQAWLSDGTDSPGTRFLHSTEAYELVDGTTVALDWADLTDGTLQNAIDLDEAGAAQTGETRVWTGTLPDGSAVASSCNDWTTSGGGPGELGAQGHCDQMDSSWTYFQAEPCSEGFHLYCFER